KMKRLFIPVVYLFLFLSVFSGCVSSPASKLSDVNSICVYGRDTCMNCQALRKSLDNAGVGYTFYNVDNDALRNSEMWDKIRKSGADEKSVLLPVVEVNGTVLVNHPTNVNMLKPYFR
ncbi:MAG: hypothetical protein JW904_09705, partial [Spirochaetales bacterium]|nr:hypothetical protein [Spirochaetales bacterium]